jgi:hypothetical protein
MARRTLVVSRMPMPMTKRAVSGKRAARALLLDRYLDVVAVNGLLFKLYQLSEIDLSTRMANAGGMNLLGFIFSQAFAQMREQMPPPVWHRFAVGNVI